MAEAAAGVASLSASATAGAVSTALVAAAVAAGAHIAVAGNVSDLATPVALLAVATHRAGAASGLLCAVTGDVTGLSAAVARLLLLRSWALAAQVALLAAVVAGRVALGRAVAGLMGSVATYTCMLVSGITVIKLQCLRRLQESRNKRRPIATRETSSIQRAPVAKDEPRSGTQGGEY